MHRTSMAPGNPAKVHISPRVLKVGRLKKNNKIFDHSALKMEVAILPT